MFSNGGIYIARFSDDTLENESRIFRGKVTDSLEPLTGLKAIRYPNSVDTVEEASRILDKRNKDVLIWGKSSWAWVTFQSGQNKKLKDLTKNETWPTVEASELYLIDSPNRYGLPIRENAHSDVFLAYELAGEFSPQEWQKQAFLKTAGLVNSLWTTNSHKAFPLWRLGNMHFIEAINSEGVESGELQCALWAYQKAASFVTKAEYNLNLRSAILNNHAVALYLKSKLENRKDLTTRYVTEFITAKYKKKEILVDSNSEISDWQAIKSNVDLIKISGEYESEKMEKKEKRKKEGKGKNHLGVSKSN
ncbi:MAG: hypothetical protein SGJ02_04250 [bacterium]|nr:hypothetical protein [bacterium]